MRVAVISPARAAILAKPKQDGYPLKAEQGFNLGRCSNHGGFAWKGKPTASNMPCPLCAYEGSIRHLWVTTHRLQAGFRVLTQDELSLASDQVQAIRRGFALTDKGVDAILNRELGAERA